MVSCGVWNHTDQSWYLIIQSWGSVPIFPKLLNPEELVLTLLLKLVSRDHSIWKQDVTRSFEVVTNRPEDNFPQLVWGYGLWCRVNVKLDHFS